MTVSRVLPRSSVSDRGHDRFAVGERLVDLREDEPLGRDDLAVDAVERRTSPCGPRPTKRHVPPTRRSISQTVTEYRSSRMPHQRLTCSGLVIASNTRCRGASNRRVSVISRSDGVVALNVSLFAARACGHVFFSFCFQFLQVVVEPIEARFPDVPVALGPVGDLLERAGLDAARAATAPRGRARSGPARSSTRRCFETAGMLMSNGSASSVTEHSPDARRARIARRVGSARAANVVLS